MATSALYQSIELLSREKGIEPEVVVGAVEEAIALATRKFYKTQENMRGELNKETGAITAYIYKTVVPDEEPVEDPLNQITLTEASELAPGVEVGSEIRMYRDTSPLGRIAAQLAKQVIFQKVREAERDTVFNEYAHREKEVLNATVKRIEEIYDSTVVIRAIAREAGERTKIAVMSRDKDVDPVGACVGMKGMRVQSIIRELRGEKIDIIEYSDEITTFAEKALQPAKVSRVSISDLTDKQLEVIVDDTQLSLAIGKKGQNVRLAAKLLGWKIDIKSEEEKRQEVEQQMQALTGGPSTPIEQVAELGEAIIQKLVAAGITTVESLADMTPEQLEEIPGIGEKTLEKISVAVRHYFGHFEEGEEGHVPEADSTDVEHAQAEAAEDEGVSVEKALSEKPGDAEIETAHPVADQAEVEAENSAEVIQEAEMVRSAEAENDILEAADGQTEALAEGEAENESMTLAEEAVEDVPVADDIDPLDAEEMETAEEDEA